MAFKILAISYKMERSTSRSFAHDMYLVQFPNEHTKWIESFLSSACIFKNRDDVFEYAVGETQLNVNKYDKEKWTTLEQMIKTQTKLVVNQWGELSTDWKWDNTTQTPTPYSTNIRYILFANDTLHIGVEQQGFLTKEECYKEHFDGFTIEEFNDEPHGYNLNIQVDASRHKIHTLRFIEV
jgi:hypothetical protein